MNDPNKIINVNLSSLLSLKAELLRKQSEVNKAKLTQNTSKEQEYATRKHQFDYTEDHVNVSLNKKDKKKRSKELEKTKEKTVYEQEDLLMLEKSQRILKAKAKFYERMQKSGGNLNSDDNCLVMFNKKKQDLQENQSNLETPYSSSEDNSSDENSNHPEDAEDEWVEYTDCLGRTRTCLKRDLAEAKRKDEQLADSMPERLDQTKANWLIDTVVRQNKDEDNNDELAPMLPQSINGDGISAVSKLEEQKANWERKEQENLEKTDVHYQDVFFDEARQHGVGYYAFSTDEEERRKQQSELQKTRQQTLEEQKRRESLKEQREKIIAERVFAAKNRQRARLGLPPLEKEDISEKKEDTKEIPAETKEDRKARKKAEKLEKKQLKEEEKRERERFNHVRPWDKEKEGVVKKNLNKSGNEEDTWKYKPEREPMTQEQWNEYKRSERLNEFAPPSQDKHIKRTNFKSNSDFYSPSNYNNIPPPEIDTGFSKFQSTRKSKTFKRRNYDESTQTHEDELPSASNYTKSGVCIPPPSNLEDFHLPSNIKKPKSSNELEKSIEAGLRFLRNNCDKEIPATKSSWTAKADY